MPDWSRFFTRLAPSGDALSHEAGQLRAHAEVARRLFADASELSERGDGAVSALLLYREGFRRLAAARALKRAHDVAQAPQATAQDEASKAPDAPEIAASAAIDETPADAVKSLFDKPEDAARLFDLDPSLSATRGQETATLLRASRRAA